MAPYIQTILILEFPCALHKQFATGWHWPPFSGFHLPNQLLQWVPEEHFKITTLKHKLLIFNFPSSTFLLSRSSPFQERATILPVTKSNLWNRWLFYLKPSIWFINKSSTLSPFRTDPESDFSTFTVLLRSFCHLWILAIASYLVFSSSPWQLLALLKNNNNNQP